MSQQVSNFTSRFSDFDISLFKAGKHFRLWEKMGSHLTEENGVQGVYFAVWAPNAEYVSVMGSFNAWSRGVNGLIPRLDGSGIWEGFIAGAKKGDTYKYFIRSTNRGILLEKADPFARFAEVPPQRASVIWGDDYSWGDGTWMQRRLAEKNQAKPMSVYEVHIASWRMKAEGNKERSLTYREMADEMVSYVQQMGFTHVEMMPVMEHPYSPSWGYQVTGYFAPSSRFGTPDEFKYLVDAFHQAGIGVLLDWVPSHYPEDAHGLGMFDGTHLYEHADRRKGFHPDWKSLIFNYGRYEVRSFLISNALFWLDQYHADGLRVDAVASMLYLDYSRKEGEWIPNIYGGNQNLEAISLLKEFNDEVHRNHPDVVTIAEESTAFPGISHPTQSGGLGFDQKWMMGWMHDTLKYFKEQTIFRRYHHHTITFSMTYAFSEHFMLPLSHDEVVHGKGTLLSRMPGDNWQRLANLRLLFGYMYTHPGTKLLFMGAELGQYQEWNHKTGLAWPMLQFAAHAKLQKFVAELNSLYRNYPALYELQFSPQGFEWLSLDDHLNSVLVYSRHSANPKEMLVIACNFTPTVREGYRVGAPAAGIYTEILNSDDERWGGSGILNSSPLLSENEPLHNRQQSIVLTLAPLAISVFKVELQDSPKTSPAKKIKGGKKPSKKQA